MWAMFSNSLGLLLKGKLFREPGAVFRQWSIGFVLSLGVLVLLIRLGVPTWVAVMAVAVIAGLLQPFLFKNLKYA